MIINKIACDKCGKLMDITDAHFITIYNKDTNSIKTETLCDECYGYRMKIFGKEEEGNSNKMKKGIKLRDLTKEEYEEWFNQNYCTRCKECVFKYVDSCNLDDEDCWIYHKDMFSDKFLDQEIEVEIVEKPKLTEFEKIILSNIDKEYKYIARDIDCDLYVYKTKPDKGDVYWNRGDGDKFPYTSLFQFITWEDEEPYCIEDLLKEE